jgi:RNA polymerase sigma-70 factor, ECF subfamily
VAGSSDGAPTSISESVLVAVARRGDEAAFAELVRRRQAWVRGLLRRLSGDSPLADDLAQEAFLHAWQHLGQLRESGAFGAWLRQIAVNIWLQHARRHRIPMDAIDETPGALNVPSEGGMSNAAGRIDLQAALEKLRPAERLCLVLAYAEGMSHGEIAEATRLPLGTVKSHVARATAKLRGWLG